MRRGLTQVLSAGDEVAVQGDHEERGEVGHTHQESHEGVVLAPEVPIQPPAGGNAMQEFGIFSPVRGRKQMTNCIMCLLND